MADVPKILLVEDEVFLKLPIEEALIAAGFECRYASSLDDGRNILNTERISAAILDINVRGIAVFSLAREIRAQGAQCIFTTGYTNAVIPPEFADAPYFQKPVDIDDVIAAVARCVKNADHS